MLNFEEQKKRVLSGLMYNDLTPELVEARRVIGAGSVITRDIPANVVAAGAPCRVIREITEADKSDYFNVLETLYDGGK